jgi:hypothetical protein
VLLLGSASAQIYHEHDKSKLREFLRQPSTEAGITNGQQLNLTLEDMLTLETDESWAERVLVLRWTDAVPKRLNQIVWNAPKLSGSLDVSGCEMLEELYCMDNGITELDVTGCTSLTLLGCDKLQLTSLDVTSNLKLKTLSCAKNRLTALDLSRNVALTGLGCDGNQLTELDITKNVLLTGLVCDNNLLTELDVSNNVALSGISCSKNALTRLDVSKNASLGLLICSENNLSALDVRFNPALLSLVCFGNRISVLDLSRNRMLMGLNGSDNPLNEVRVGLSTPLSVADPAFEGMGVNLSNVELSSAALHVPEGTKMLYASAPVWREFGTIWEDVDMSSHPVVTPHIVVTYTGGTLLVNSPESELIEVYSIDGALLFGFRKPAGSATFALGHLPSGVLVIRGSSGWVKKLSI